MNLMGHVGKSIMRASETTLFKNDIRVIVIQSYIINVQRFECGMFCISKN